jgi:hypothetical protein
MMSSEGEQATDKSDYFAGSIVLGITMPPPIGTVGLAPMPSVTTDVTATARFGAQPKQDHPCGATDNPSDWPDEPGAIESRCCKSRWNHQIEPDDDSPPQNLGFPTVIIAQIEESSGGLVEAQKKYAPDEDHDADVPSEGAFYGGQGGHGKGGLEHDRGCMVNKVF